MRVKCFKCNWCPNMSREALVRAGSIKTAATMLGELPGLASAIRFFKSWDRSGAQTHKKTAEISSADEEHKK